MIIGERGEQRRGLVIKKKKAKVRNKRQNFSKRQKFRSRRDRQSKRGLLDSRRIAEVRRDGVEENLR